MSPADEFISLVGHELYRSCNAYRASTAPNCFVSLAAIRVSRNRLTCGEVVESASNYDYILLVNRQGRVHTYE